MLNASETQGDSRQFNISMEETRSVDTFPWSDDFSTFDTNFWTLSGTGNWQHMARLNHVYCDFFNWASGTEAIITSDVINLPASDVMELSFEWGHNYWITAPAEAGYVEVSTDNSTWTTLWSQIGSTFDSDPNDMFPPAFITETISLAQYSGQSIYIRVRGVSDYGADFYFDSASIYSAGVIMPGSITGVITDTDGGAYTDLNVTIIQTGESCITDSTGFFSFQNISPGVYELEIAQNGYRIELYDNVIVSTGSITDVAIPVSRGGIITGNIVDDRGIPVFCTVNLSGLLYQTSTDSLGNYCLVQVQEGFYDVHVLDILHCADVADSIFIADDSVTVVDFQLMRNCRIHLAISTFDNVYDNMQINLTGAQDYSFPHHYDQITLRDMRPGTYDVTVTRDGCTPFTSLGNVVDPGTCDTIDVVLDQLTGTNENNVVKFSTELIGAYPNPFNPETNLSYSIAEEGKTELAIYNIKGQKVRSLVNENHAPGEYSAIWKGRSDEGKSVSSGVYFAVLKAGKKILHQKLMLLK